MTKNHNNSGFTLVELIVTIAIGSMITLAATSLLLLGLRLHYQSNTVAAQQNTVNMLFTVLDNIALNKDITVIDIEGAENDWVIQYGGSGKIAYTTASKSLTVNGNEFLKNVESASAEIHDQNLLTVRIETEHSEYNMTVYCRLRDGGK